MLFHLSLSGSRGLEFVPATIGREAGVLCGQICSQGRETSTHIHTCGRFRITRWPPLTLSWWQQIVGGCLVVGASLYQYRGLYLSILKALGQLIVIWCCINNIERKSNEYTLHDKPHDYNIHTDIYTLTLHSLPHEWWLKQEGVSGWRGQCWLQRSCNTHTHTQCKFLYS